MPVTFVEAVVPPGPATNAFVVVPNDVTIFPFMTRSLWIGAGAAGAVSPSNVSVLLNGDSVAVTFLNVPPGTSLDVSVQKVLATGTTATSILGMY